MALMDEMRRRVAESIRSRPALWNLLNPPYRRTLDRLNEMRLRSAFRNEMIFDEAAGNDACGRLLDSGRPAALGKIGSLEGEAVTCFLKGRDYPGILRKQLLDNVGVHPVDTDSLNAFCAEYLKATDALDLLAARGHPGETDLIKRVPKRTLVPLRSFESWLHPNPWSAALQGKRVIVVTPFAESVSSQFRRRMQIWRNPRILPPFELRVVKMPLSPGLVAPTERNWQERFAGLIEECERAPYDVMLVGAGGLSLPLVAHAKARGRAGFHLGGHTQILFGVMGKRWDRDARLLSLQTDAWVRPSGAEAPSTVVKVEQGCYW
jgi:hypothetical protein